jgi:hypothetical protein
MNASRSLTWTPPNEKTPDRTPSKPLKVIPKIIAKGFEGFEGSTPELFPVNHATKEKPPASPNIQETGRLIEKSPAPPPSKPSKPRFGAENSAKQRSPGVEVENRLPLLEMAVPARTQPRTSGKSHPGMEPRLATQGGVGSSDPTATRLPFRGEEG